MLFKFYNWVALKSQDETNHHNKNQSGLDFIPTRFLKIQDGMEFNFSQNFKSNKNWNKIVIRSILLSHQIFEN